MDVVLWPKGLHIHTQGSKLKTFGGLYSPQNDPDPEMIPKSTPKWFWPWSKNISWFDSLFPQSASQLDKPRESNKLHLLLTVISELFVILQQMWMFEVQNWKNLVAPVLTHSSNSWLTVEEHEVQQTACVCIGLRLSKQSASHWL